MTMGLVWRCMHPAAVHAEPLLNLPWMQDVLLPDDHIFQGNADSDLLEDVFRVRSRPSGFASHVTTVCMSFVMAHCLTSGPPHVHAELLITYHAPCWQSELTAKCNLCLSV